MITQQRLHEIFNYSDGKLLWKVMPSSDMYPMFNFAYPVRQFFT